MSAPSVAVIGAGNSGLAAAWFHKASFDVTVLEREETVGGTIGSMENGWLVETGPNSVLETTPLFHTLFTDIGIQDEVIYAHTSGNNRYILRNGFLHALPMSVPTFFKSKLWTPSGKLRLLKEPFVGRADHEETVAEFVERRLGREFLDYAINPFVAGVYAGDPAQLSARAAFRSCLHWKKNMAGSSRPDQRASERKKRAESKGQGPHVFLQNRNANPAPIDCGQTCRKSADWCNGHRYHRRQMTAEIGTPYRAVRVDRTSPSKRTPSSSQHRHTSPQKSSSR